MMNSRVSYDSEWDQTTPSARSRASSVFSTGTKFSIATMSHEDFQGIEPNIAGPSSGNRSRPRSFMGFDSHEDPAPPYYDRQALNVPQISPNNPGFSELGHLSLPSIDNLDILSRSEEPENVLSLHYGRIVRTIDQKYAADLLRLTQSHERELAAIRHEIDQAYRKEYKVKNQEVERFRAEANTRVADLETEMEALILTHEEAVERMQRDSDEKMANLAEINDIAIDKARNKIEDMWEERWSDRTRLAAEEARRINIENQRKLEKAVADRDDEWVRELGNRHPELLGELKDTISELRAGK